MITDRIRRCGLVTAVLIFCGFLFAETAAGEVRHALVIGNGNYEIPLITSRQDARAIATKLNGLDFEVSHLQDGNRRRMRKALQQFAAQAEDADVLLFYFAGHGVQVNGRNYLVPAKTRIERVEDVPRTTVALDEVYRIFWDSNAAVKIVILDACRDNPFVEPDPDGSDVWVPGLAQPFNAPPGTVTLFAAQPGETAEDGRDDHSPFTASLLYFMTEPGLELRDLFTAVRTSVLAATSGVQTPWEDGSPLQEFYFRAPATIVGQIHEGDDEVLVLLNGEEQMSWGSGRERSRTIRLKPGENQLVVKVFNQSTYRGACNFFRQAYEDILPILSPLERIFGIRIDPIQPPEGWRYKVVFRASEDSTDSLLELRGADDPPRPEHHGEMFTVARATIFVDRESGEISFPEVDREVWRH